MFKVGIIYGSPFAVGENCVSFFDQRDVDQGR